MAKVQCLYHRLHLQNKEYLTEENSCFVIRTDYLNEGLCRHCNFPNECPFPGLSGSVIKFLAVKRGIYLGRGALSDNYSTVKTSGMVSKAVF